MRGEGRTDGAGRTATLTSSAGYVDMLPVALTNAVLVIVTFNAFIFWAKSNVRRYLWRTTFVQGEALFYSGDGAELARGFVVTFILFLLVFGYPGLVVINALDVDPELLTLPDTGVLVSLVLAVVVPAVISAVALVLLVAPHVETTPLSVGICAVVLWLGIVYFTSVSRFLTYRYLLRHTHWCGAAGDVPGSPWKYAMRLLLPELSNGLTAGWSAPWRFVRRFEYLLNGATLAGRAVAFEGNSKPLYGPFAIAWTAVAVLLAVVNGVAGGLEPEEPYFAIEIAALCLIALGGVVLAMAYYNARLFAHVAASITLDDVGLRFHATARDLATLFLINLVMNVLSVGLSYYYTRMRIARFIIRHLEISGELPVGRSAPPDEPRKDLLGEGGEVFLGVSYL